MDRNDLPHGRECLVGCIDGRGKTVGCDCGRDAFLTSLDVIVAERDALRARIADLEKDRARCLDTQWDGTDAACPAWWRGQDDGCRGMEAKLQQRIADLEAGTALAKLRAELGDANRRIAEIEQDRARLDTLEAWAVRHPRVLVDESVNRLVIAWPANTTLRETADAIRATMDSGVKGKKVSVLKEQQ